MKEYETPVFEIVMICEDVIVTSTGDDTPPAGGDFE
jgi:hypothetical protein